MKTKYKVPLLLIFFLLNISSFAQTPEILIHNEQIAITELVSLNSDLQETNLSISPDGKYLYFMSDRGGQSWSIPYGQYNGKRRFDGDIWFSEKKDYVWQKPVCVQMGVNTSGGEDEPNISPDGQFVLFQSWKSTWSVTGGPYYEAELSGKSWNVIGGVGGGIHQFFQEKSKGYRAFATDGASLSPDRKTFVVASGQFYEGNMDLYICKKKAGKWDSMKKMDISTEGNERSIFIAGDGQTIFFASDSYESGFGGLDIYKATLLKDGICIDIQNIGEPFNTPEDDYGFILTSTGREAYFVRNGDIFFADLLNADKRIKPRETKIITGIVTNTDNEYVESYLELTHNDSVICSSKSNSETGKFLFIVDAKYKKMKIQDTKKELINQEIFLNEEGSTAVQVKSKMKKTFRAIVNFDLNKSILRTKGKNKLDSISKVLEKASVYSISLSGHTDSKGSDSFNEKLGKNRAISVRKYLVKKGVDPSKIIFKGYGETKPAADNSSEKGAAKNRRTIITINATF